MERLIIDPRPIETVQVARLDYPFHNRAGTPTWTEDAYYRFSQTEIDMLAETAERVHGLHIDAMQAVITQRLFPVMGIEAEISSKIVEWWDSDVPTILGRMDFLYDGINPPKLISYNADTVGNLFESAVIQAKWREQYFPAAGQFNHIHAALVDRWRELLIGHRNSNHLHVTADPAKPEDAETVHYIGRTAKDAGYTVKFTNINDIGLNSETKTFYDQDDQPITQIYKQYPWKLFIRDPYGEFIDPARCWWLEPFWKIAVASKAMLPTLWERYPEHPNLLAASQNLSDLTGEPYVRKSVAGRTGENIQIVADQKIIAETRGDADDGDYIYQQFREPANFGGYRPNVCVWIVCDKACGIGVREDTNLIIRNTSRFVPHIIG